MANLFSVFDPKSFFNLPFHWLSILGVFMIVHPKFWMVPSARSSSGLNWVKGMSKEFSSLLKSTSNPGITHLTCSFLLLILLTNTLGLLPHVFTSSSHLSFTLSLSLPLWLGYYVSCWAKNSFMCTSHLVPSGSPMALAPLMVLIELVSSLIRPVTLAVRLAANMVAGHLLITLLSTNLPYLSSTFLVLVMIPLITLMILETAVAAIQAYVFSILMTLYISEISI